MIANAILLLAALILSTLVVSLEFHLLLKKKINFGQALKTYSIAVALNRLLLTGSGYAASSLKLKQDKIPLYMTLASFTIIESLSTAPWLAAGFYFGARLGKEAPGIVLGVLCLVMFFLWLFRKKISGFLKDLFGYIREIKYTIFIILPLVCLNFILGITYYYLFFRLFDIALPCVKIIKSVSVSFTIGYLSFLPSGVGIREGGLVFMLMQEKVPLAKALSFAIADRMVSTGFYLGLGLLFGAPVIGQAIRGRFRKAR